MIKYGLNYIILIYKDIIFILFNKIIVIYHI